MYLLQRCEDGVMLRQFEGTLSWKKTEDYQIADCHVSEVRRAIFTIITMYLIIADVCMGRHFQACQKMN